MIELLLGVILMVVVCLLFLFPLFCCAAGRWLAYGAMKGLEMYERERQPLPKELSDE